MQIAATISIVPPTIPMIPPLHPIATATMPHSIAMIPNGIPKTKKPTSAHITEITASACPPPLLVFSTEYAVRAVEDTRLVLWFWRSRPQCLHTIASVWISSAQ